MPPRGVKKGSKRARQYEHIKDSALERGESEDTAEEIAARTVNKGACAERRGAASRRGCRARTCPRAVAAVLRSHRKGPRGRTSGPALRRGQGREHPRALEDDEGRAPACARRSRRLTSSRGERAAICFGPGRVGTSATGARGLSRERGQRVGGGRRRCAARFAARPRARPRRAPTAGDVRVVVDLGEREDVPSDLPHDPPPDGDAAAPAGRPACGRDATAPGSSALRPHAAQPGVRRLHLARRGAAKLVAGSTDVSHVRSGPLIARRR